MSHRQEEQPLIPFHDFFEDVARAEPRPVEWVIRNLLPTGLSFFSGAPKLTQKTTLAMAMAEMVSGLCDPPNTYLPAALSHVEMHGRVMMFCAEDDAGELKVKVQECFGREPKEVNAVFAAHDTSMWMLDDEKATENLWAWIHQLDPMLVVMDPFRNFHVQDENDSAEMVKLLRPFQKWAKQYKRAFVLTHHVTKPSPQHDGHSALFTVRGSGAIVGAADSNHVISAPRSDGSKTWNAVFKRAPSWTRDIKTGGWGAKAEVCLTTLEQGVKGLWERDLTSIADIAAQVNAGPDAVKQAIAELKRWEVLK